MKSLSDTPTPAEREAWEHEEALQTYLKVALREFKQDYFNGDCRLKSTLKKANWLASKLPLSDSFKSKKLNDFKRDVCSKKVERSRKSSRTLTPSFCELCHSLVESSKLPKSRDINCKSSAYEHVSQLLKQWGVREGCTANMVYNACRRTKSLSDNVLKDSEIESLPQT